MNCITRTTVATALVFLAFHQSVEAGDGFPRPATAPAPIWQGLFVGGHLGYGRATTGAGLDMQGAAGGAHIGYMFQEGRGVFGIEADITAAAIHETDSANLGGYVVTATAALDMLGSVRGVLGFDVGPALLYGTAGLGFASGTLSASTYGLTLSTELSATGYVVGGGVEFRASRQIGVRVEALHYGFSEISIAGTTQKTDLSTTVARAGVTVRMN